MTLIPPRVPATIQAVIALLLVAAFVGVLFGPAMFGKQWIPPSDVLTQLLSTLVTLAVGYYLGSSAGSAVKDQQAATVQSQTIDALGVAAAAFPPAPKTADGVPIVKVDASGPVAVKETPSPPIAMTS